MGDHYHNPSHGPDHSAVDDNSNGNGNGHSNNIWGNFEVMFERMIFESRWLLMPLFFGLIVALAGFSIQFCYMVYKFMLHLFDYDKNELLVMMLTFVDKVLVGTLIGMVIIGSYENSVSKLHIPGNKKRLSWLGKIDSATLKIKLSTSIVSISSIHLLKVFLAIDHYPPEQIYIVHWTVLIHFIMVITAIMLAAMDRVQGGSH